MRQIPNYGDERNTCFCIHCGGTTGTGDHAPSKVLLDKPYPAELPVVPSCSSCNGSFSRDEEYLACLVECVLAGSVEPGHLQRHKVKEILGSRPGLAERLRKARREEAGEVIFDVEMDRVRRVMLKLARCHAAHELNEPQLDEPAAVNMAPVHTLNEEARMDFDMPPELPLLPEVGSRALTRFVEDGRPAWIVAQEGRYRYLVVQAPAVIVRAVLSEYLACEVIWN